MRASGQLDEPSPVKPEMQDKGRPESSITGAAGEGERPGQLGTLPKPATPKACEVRGNSNGHRRHSRRLEAKGQPEGSDAGSTERERGKGNLETQPGRSGRIEGAGQLATSSTGRTGRCMIHRAKDHPESARGRKVSGVFDFGGIARDQSVVDFRISPISSAVRTVARRGKNFSIREACSS